MFLLFAILMIVSSIDCANKKTDIVPIDNTTDTSGTSSVETRKPNSNYKPAFAGQTRIAAVKQQRHTRLKSLQKN